MQRSPIRGGRTADLRADRRARVAVAPRLHEPSSAPLRNRLSRPDGRFTGVCYDGRQITASPPPGQALVAPRSIAVSHFRNDGGTLYFAGYDTNKAPAHTTAWIFRTSLATALGASHE